jgi:hypothetical protein
MSVFWMGAHHNESIQAFAAVSLASELAHEVARDSMRQHTPAYASIRQNTSLASELPHELVREKSTTDLGPQELSTDKGGADVVLQAARHMALVHQAATEMASKESAQASICCELNLSSMLLTKPLATERVTSRHQVTN